MLPFHERQINNVSTGMRYYSTSLLKGRTQPRCIAVAAVIAFILLVFTFFGYNSRSELSTGFLFTPHTQIPGELPADFAANATLGFQTILTLATEPSWRTRGLQAAANLTGLTINVPKQPHNPDELVKAFEEIGKGKANAHTPNHGSATAWMAHLDLLKFVISSDFSSTLIVEDDVDWDIDIKDQMRLISTNVRKLTQTGGHDKSAFGPHWDVLWLGNCGEKTDGNEGLHIDFEDKTRIPTESYSGWAKSFLRKGPKDEYRRVQEARNPVCSFGYGITKDSAQKILSLLAKGADEAFDVAMQHKCQSGALRCIVVFPEVMHHYEPPKNAGYNSLVHEGDGQNAGAPEDTFEGKKGSTANIVHSARCHALFNEDCLAPPREIIIGGFIGVWEIFFGAL